MRQHIIRHDNPEYLFVRFLKNKSRIECNQVLYRLVQLATDSLILINVVLSNPRRFQNNQHVHPHTGNAYSGFVSVVYD